MQSRIIKFLRFTTGKVAGMWYGEVAKNFIS